MSSPPEFGNEVPEWLKGEKAAKFWNSLGSSDREIFSGLSEDSRQWLGNYIRCTGGPRREYLIDTCMGVPQFRIIVLRILCFDPLFKNVAISFQELNRLFKALRKFEYVEDRSSASDFEEEEQLAEPVHRWNGRRRRNMKYGTRVPPAGLSTSQVRRKDEEVVGLLEEIAGMMVEVTSAENVDELREVLKFMTPAGKVFRKGAARVLTLDPSRMNLAWIQARNPELGKKINDQLKEYPLREVVEESFDRQVLGFRT